jgi:hypothetical protein
VLPTPHPAEPESLSGGPPGGPVARAPGFRLRMDVPTSRTTRRAGRGGRGGDPAAPPSPPPRNKPSPCRLGHQPADRGAWVGQPAGIGPERRNAGLARSSGCGGDAPACRQMTYRIVGDANVPCARKETNGRAFLGRKSVLRRMGFASLTAPPHSGHAPQRDGSGGDDGGLVMRLCRPSAPSRLIC